MEDKMGKEEMKSAHLIHEDECLRQRDLSPEEAAGDRQRSEEDRGRGRPPLRQVQGRRPKRTSEENLFRVAAATGSAPGDARRAVLRTANMLNKNNKISAAIHFAGATPGAGRNGKAKCVIRG